MSIQPIRHAMWHGVSSRRGSGLEVPQTDGQNTCHRVVAVCVCLVCFCDRPVAEVVDSSGSFG
eukprot:3861800-Prorocentrum_lima.AAC.1